MSPGSVWLISRLISNVDYVLPGILLHPGEKLGKIFHPGENFH